MHLQEVGNVFAQFGQISLLEQKLRFYFENLFHLPTLMKTGSNWGQLDFNQPLREVSVENMKYSFKMYQKGRSAKNEGVKGNEK